MVAVATPVVADHGAHVFGHGVDVAQQIFHALLAQLRMFLDGSVEVVDVSLVVAIVMNLHRLGVDVRLQRVE